MKIRRNAGAIATITVLFGLSACASNFMTPYADPVSFDAAQYCEMDRRTDLSIPAEIEAALEDDGVAEERVAVALLTKAAMEIAYASEDRESCEQTFSQGNQLFEERLLAA